MRVLIYQPNYIGHHFSYLGQMLPGFRGLPIELGLATTQQAIESDEFKKCILEHTDFLQPLPWCRPPAKNTFVNAYRRQADLHNCAAKWKADHVCVVYADGIWQLEAMKSFLPQRSLGNKAVLEGWLFRGGFSYPTSTKRIDGVKRKLFEQLLRRGVFSKLHLQDELLEQFAKSICNTQTEIALAADPIQVQRQPSTQSAREQLGIPEDGRRIISCTGMVDRRKGVHHAIQAFLHLTENSPSIDATLLLIGPHHRDIHVMLTDPRIQPLVDSGYILSIDRFLSSEEMLLVAEASEIVLAPYPNHSGRSSIILWAAAAGTRVLAVDRGCIKHVVETHHLGSTCDVTDVVLFSSAILEALTQGWTLEDKKRSRSYAFWHRIENYQRMSSALVRQRLREAGKLSEIELNLQ